jgi:hypothetical protein
VAGTPTAVLASAFEAFEGRFLLGVEGVVDDVVEDAAHRGGLVCLDLADDLQFGVVVGPLELVAEAGGGLHLEALADDRGEGFLVAGLLRASATTSASELPVKTM